MTKHLNIHKDDFVSEGSSGVIYRLHNYKNTPCVIKLAKNQYMSSLLRNEASIYKILQNKCKYLPKYFEEGIYHNNITNEDMFGIIIEYIPYKTMYDNIMYITSKNINKVFVKILKILEFFHKHNLVIRDIKPENFLYDPIRNRVWMIDLGLITFAPMTYNSIENYTGTLRYISPRCHDHVNTYFDDIESAIYSIIYCYYGYLPWKIIKLPNQSEKEYENKIKSIKESDKIDNMISVFPTIKTVYKIVKEEDNLIDKPDYETIFELF